MCCCTPAPVSLGESAAGKKLCRATRIVRREHITSVLIQFPTPLAPSGVQDPLQSHGTHVQRHPEYYSTLHVQARPEAAAEKDTLLYVKVSASCAKVLNKALLYYYIQNLYSALIHIKTCSKVLDSKMNVMVIVFSQWLLRSVEWIWNYVTLWTCSRNI